MNLDVIVAATLARVETPCTHDAAPALTVAEATAQWLRGFEVDHHGCIATIKAAQVRSKNWVTFFGQTPLESVTIADVEAYKRARLESGVKPITLRHYLVSLGAFFIWAVNMGYRADNPVARVKKPSAADAVRDHVVTPEEEAAYFQTVLSRFTVTCDGAVRVCGPWQHLHDLARCVLDQGMRPMEVLGLRVPDVDLAAGLLHIRKSKTRAGRRALYMTPAVAAIISRRVADAAPDGKLFSMQGLSNYQRLHRLVIKKIGCKPWPVYSLRHTFCTRFVQARGDASGAAAVLGHSGLRMLANYTHLRSENVMRSYVQEIANKAG